MTQAELAELGYAVDEKAWSRLAEFVRSLLEENTRVNLTAVRTAEEVWRRHVCDSLALVPLMDERRPTRLLDLGSGGGVPGIPLACVFPDLPVTLLDATRRKTEALMRIVAGVGLARVAVKWGRAESVAHDRDFRERYDVVTARAVAALPILLEYVAGFVAVGGEAWLFKTQGEVEREEAGGAARACGLEEAGVREYMLPGDDVGRLIVRYRKVAPLAADLPRGPGRAEKRPLHGR